MQLHLLIQVQFIDPCFLQEISAFPTSFQHQVTATSRKRLEMGRTCCTNEATAPLRTPVTQKSSASRGSLGPLDEETEVQTSQPTWQHILVLFSHG